jgi:hypothetical protein
MALTQEEIRIRAGLDYSKVTAGLTDIRKQVFKLANDVPNRMFNLLKANVYMAAASLVNENLTKAVSTFWDKVYGVDEAGTQRLEQQGNMLRKLRDTVQKSLSDLQKAERDSKFDKAGDAGKMDILTQELSASDAKVKKAKEELDFAVSHNQTLERRKMLEVELNNALTEQIKSQDALRKLSDKLSPETLKDIFTQRLNETRPQVYKDRIDIRSLQDEIMLDPSRSDLKQNYRDAVSRIGAVTRARNIEGLGTAANALPDVGMFQGIRESLLAAQVEAMKNVVQKVSIVEIK